MTDNMKSELERLYKEAVTNNMKIWDALKTTDPNKTKKVEFGRKFTSINSQWQLQRMTEQFGPIGAGWGYDVEHSVERISDEYVLAIADVSIWWETETQTYGPVRGMSPIVEKGRNGLHFDDDAGKKAMTDALTKGLSHLGLSADVFLGLFDDNKYIKQITEQFRDGRMPPNETPMGDMPSVPEEDRALLRGDGDKSQYEINKRAEAERFVKETLDTWGHFSGGLDLADWYNMPRSPKGKKTNRDWIGNLENAFPDLHMKLETAAEEVRLRQQAAQ